MRFIVLPHCACAPCVRTDGQAELLRASERSERSEHIVVVSSRFYYIYSVTKILRKIRVTTFTERLRKITREGPGAPGMSNAASN